MPDIEFIPLHPWSLPPVKPHTDRTTARTERDLYQQHFRHLRITRLPADCPPWTLGQNLGWTVASPITLTMTPLDDIDVAVPDDEDLRTVSRRTGRSEMWKRGDDWIATSHSWPRMCDYRTPTGEWEGMFLPNGAGTLEWRLGFAARIPEPYFLTVLPLDPPLPGLDIPLGIIGAKTVNAMEATGGISIAIRPTHPLTLHRHQPIARLVLLHPDSLRATATTRPGTT